MAGSAHRKRSWVWKLCATPRGSIIKRVYRFIAFNPRIVLAGVALLTAAAIAGIIDIPDRTLRLRVETAVDKILPHGSPDRVFYEDFQQRFGSDNLVYLGWVLESGDVFTSENLTRIQRLTSRLEQTDGVHEVISLSNASDIRAEGDGVVTGDIYEDVPEDAEGIAALRERVLSNPLHSRKLVSHDATAVAFLVFPEEMSEREFRKRGIDLDIERLAREEAPPGAKVLLAGGPPIKAETSRTLLRDLLRFMPAGYILMGLVGWLAFRSVRGVALPLVAITLSLAWTFAVLALSGRPLNLVTFIVPSLIQAVGFAYAVHVVSEHDDALREGATGPGAVLLALERVAFPVLLTAATTAAGFSSLTLSRIPAIREFGAFCTIGVIASSLAVLTFLPAVLALIRKPRLSAHPSQGRPERWATRVAAFDIRYRTGILTAGACVTMLAIYGVTRIEISTSFVDNLMDDNPLRLSVESFDGHLNGSMTIYLVLDAAEENAFKEPQRLRELRELQDWIEKQPEVASTTSVADYVMTMNRAFNDDDPEAFVVPDSRPLIGQYVFIFWDDQLEKIVDPSFDSVNVRIRGSYLTSSAAVQLLDRIDAQAAKIPGLITGTTGSLAVVARTMDEIAFGQARSLTAATLIIFAILAVYFRSLRVAAWALIPNALPVLVYFGLLGLTGITLNVITSLIACIILGIAVDDTIHFLVRFRERALESNNEPEAAIEALRIIARPITTTTMALCGAFSVLMASGLRHQVEFGILATALLAFAWLVDVTLAPALASRLGVNRGRSSR